VKGQDPRTGILNTMIYENFSLKRIISKRINSTSECAAEKWLVLNCGYSEIFGLMEKILFLASILKMFQIFSAQNENAISAYATK
jgi:hypothetical protein